jgi:hypothetical protein
MEVRNVHMLQNTLSALKGRSIRFVGDKYQVKHGRGGGGGGFASGNAQNNYVTNTYL